MIAARNSCMHSWRQGVTDTLAAMTTAVSGSDYALSCYLDTVREQRHCTPSPSNRYKQTEGCGCRLLACCPESRAISNMLEFNKRHSLLPSSHHFAGCMNCGPQSPQQLLLVYHPMEAILHYRWLTSAVDTGNMGSPAHGKQLHVQLPLVLLHAQYRLQSKQRCTYFHASDISSSVYFIK